MTTLRRAAALLVMLAVLAAVARLSAWPLRLPDNGAGAMLRLSWRAVGERVEQCRTPTPEELARTPAHMRQARICEGVRVPRYRLRVVVDDSVLVDGTVPGSGVRGDRPMYIYHEAPIAAGSHRIEVLMERAEPGAAPPPTADSMQVGGRSQSVFPARLSLDTTAAVGARGIVLVTYDAEARRLVVRGGGT